MKTMQKGFTLIELMIVVAIIGILAAIALPAYQDYIARSKLSEAMTFLSTAKTSVSEFVASNNAVPADANTAGIDIAPGNAKYIAAMGYARNGSIQAIISATLNNQVSTLLSTAGTNKVGLEGVVDINNGTVTWVCVAQDAAMYRFIPANCRNAKSVLPAWP
jgi:type IV pilus assembly protein PilA